MNQKYKQVIKHYFSDYVKWLIVVTVLFTGTLTACICFNGFSPFIWVIPASFAIIYLLSSPLFVLFLRAKKDLRQNAIQKKTIFISDLQTDRSFNFKNRGGALIGDIKYQLTDQENTVFHLSSFSEKGFFTSFSPDPAFAVKIEFLESSKLIIRMQIEEAHLTPKQVREQRRNVNQFRKSFNFYF